MMTSNDNMLELESLDAVVFSGSESTNSDPAAFQQRFVCFQLGLGSYCVRADEVIEISHQLTVTKLPGGTAPLMGITSLQGEIAAVVDLRTILNEKPPAFSSKPKFVVLMAPDNGCPIALPVDGMRDMISATEADPSPDMPKTAFIKSSVPLDGTAAGVVDIGEIRNAVTHYVAL